MDSFVKVFASYEVYLAAVAIVAVMTGFKKAVRLVGQTKGQMFLKKVWVGLVLSSGNVVLGALVGCAPGFLPGESWFERVLVGIVAGFMSNTLYGVVKRVLPDTMEASEATKGLLQRKE